MINRLKVFLQEAKAEFKRINWPSRQETIRMTGIVIIISLGVAFFLGILDFVFTTALSQII